MGFGRSRNLQPDLGSEKGCSPCWNAQTIARLSRSPTRTATPLALGQGPTCLAHMDQKDGRGGGRNNGRADDTEP
eukprot:874579-Heterocapsa_arctica.AAC.1